MRVGFRVLGIYRGSTKEIYRGFYEGSIADKGSGTLVEFDLKDHGM